MSPAIAHPGEVIGVVADYFGSDEIPMITQHFAPGRGWTKHRYTDPLSRARVRALRGQGATSVALDLGGRTVDFTVAELLHVDRRCLLGSGPRPGYPRTTS